MQQATRNGGQNPNIQQQQQQPQQTQNEGNNQNIIGGGSLQNTGQKIHMRDNLHYAADSVSHAMTSLVNELHTG